MSLIPEFRACLSTMSHSERAHIAFIEKPSYSLRHSCGVRYPSDVKGLLTTMHKYYDGIPSKLWRLIIDLEPRLPLITRDFPIQLIDDLDNLIKNIISKAAEAGDVELLKHVIDKKESDILNPSYMYVLDTILEVASLNGHVHVLKFWWCEWHYLQQLLMDKEIENLSKELENLSTDTDSPEYETAYDSGCAEAYWKSVDSSYPKLTLGIVNASKHGHLEAMEYLAMEWEGGDHLLHGNYKYEEVISNSVKNGHLHVLMWLEDEDYNIYGFWKTCDEIDAINIAHQNGHHDVSDWLQRRGVDSTTG